MPLRLSNGSFRLRTILWVLILIVLPFTLFAILSRPEISYEELLERHISELKERLGNAELMNVKREEELRLLNRYLHELFILSKSNLTNGSSTNLRLPEQVMSKVIGNLSAMRSPESGFLNYLPHMIGKPDALTPDFRLSKDRVGVSVVIGVPTIKREKHNYLRETLDSLVKNLNDENRQDVLIVVMVAEPNDSQYVVRQADEIQKYFKEHVDSGLIEVISPSSRFYPPLKGLPQTLEDPPERVKWRAKQVLDFAFLMVYARNKGLYYLQLEDDVITKPGYISTIKSFTKNQHRPWIYLTFSQLGFIGKLFRCTDLYKFVDFLLMFYQDKPIDWLLYHFVHTKVCNIEKDQKNCLRQFIKYGIQFKPSLFQHIGLHSSLRGKVQKLKDKLFGKATLYKGHSNPSADVTTSLKAYKTYGIQRAYVGETFFWGLNPQQGDTVTFSFHPHILIDSIFFKSGNTDHADDIFRNTTVEVNPEANLETKPSKYNVTSDGFYVVSKFDKVGIAQAKLDLNIPISSLRLFCRSDSPNWVILSEILIKVTKDITPQVPSRLAAAIG